MTRFDGTGLGRWAATWLRLTTPTGKIASLECVEDSEGEIQVYAIERHFGVTRVLEFDLSAEDDDEGAPLVGDVVVDLSRLEELPNMEGVSLHGEQMLIVTDHDTDPETGTTQTIVLGPSDD